MKSRRIGIAAIAVLAAACSHVTPFYRGDAAAPPVSEGEVLQRLLLIGDAGDPDLEGEPVLATLRRRVELLPERTTVVFLGDNVYETGMPDDSPLEGTVLEDILDEVLLNLYESRSEAERRVNAQVDAVRDTAARAVFVPGNHDWDQFGVGGWERVMALETYLERLRLQSGADVRLLPGGGCPGPVRVPLGTAAELLVLDTQWWLDAGPKPTPDSNPTGCGATSEGAVLAQLRAALTQIAKEGRHAIVVAHHPLDSHGPHNGFADYRTHLFPLRMAGSYVPALIHWLPLPGLGSLMVWTRACCSPNAQDLPARANRALRAKLEQAMREAAAEGAAPLLYAAGHEHSLQLFRGQGGARFTAVSGLGSRSKASGVGHGARTLFAHSDPDRAGFMQLDFAQDGSVRIAVVETAEGMPEGSEVYSHPLVRRGEITRAR